MTRLHKNSFGRPPRAHPHLYEVNTWAWLEELSAAQGRPGRRLQLGDVPDKVWDDFKTRGFDLVWLMGLWQRSPEGRRIARTEPALLAAFDQALPGWQDEDVVGSPYAVKAYRPDPALGDWDQVEWVRDKLHERGLGLILDFVPNHTAVDHEWIQKHPQFYVAGTEVLAAQRPGQYFPVKAHGRTTYLAHGKDPNFSPWTDTAQLNYFNPATRTALLNQLRTIAQHCDGVRCDMAMLVLNNVFAATWAGHLAEGSRPAREFWAEAVAALPGFLWIAEVYWGREWELQQLGFQFTYDKRLYDRLRAGSAHEILTHLGADRDYQSKCVRFLENHDEERCTAVFGKDRLPAAAALLATLPGMRFYHQGQLEGRRRRLPVQLRRAAEEPPDRTLVRWYGRLLEITKDDLFHIGRWRLLEVSPAEGRSAGQARSDGRSEDHSDSQILAYQWRTDSAWAILVANWSDQPAHGRVLIGEELGTGFAETATLVFVDRLHGQAYERRRAEVVQEGLPVQLVPYGVQLLMVTSTGKGSKGVTDAHHVTG